MQFSDLPRNLQETAQFILGDNCTDHPKVVCMAELLHAFHKLKQVTMLKECMEDDCEEFGAVVRPDENVLCPRHDRAWPWCETPGCRNKAYKRKGHCHPHRMVEHLKGMLIVDPETQIAMPLEEYLKWKEK